MIPWIRKWLSSKIQITINYVTDGVTPSVTPIVTNQPVIQVSKKSNLRFKSQYEVDPDGNETTYYFTEEYINGKWAFVSKTFFADKQKAMDVHLKLINGTFSEPKKVETVLWEGLSKEEAEAWVSLQK